MKTRAPWEDLPGGGYDPMIDGVRAPSSCTRGLPCSVRRTYKAHGATVMDEAGGFAVCYGVDVTRARMIADALNAQNH